MVLNWVTTHCTSANLMQTERSEIRLVVARGYCLSPIDRRPEIPDTPKQKGSDEAVELYRTTASARLMEQKLRLSVDRKWAMREGQELVTHTGKPTRRARRITPSAGTGLVGSPKVPRSRLYNEDPGCE